MFEKKYSALDNDLYKFTMQQAVLHHYPDAYVKYEFKCRNPKTLKSLTDKVGVSNFIDTVLEEIDKYFNVRFAMGELNYLDSIRFFKSDYIDFLEDFTFKKRYVKLKQIKNDEIIFTVEGPWVQVILFEVPLLAIFSEVYSEYASSCFNSSLKYVKKIVDEAVELFILYADFGTRRRFSFIHQYLLLEQLSKLKNFVGTSNVLFAKTFKVKPIGTMAHEWLQAHQALVRVSDSQKISLDVWAREYRGDLGIALSDVVGFDAFLNDFDMYFAKLFDGCRHDSGNPFEWCTKLINHYEKLGIDPKTKKAVFSDGLNFETASKIYDTFANKIQVSFGIGTFLTNSCDIEPLQIVMKMIECNGKPVAKISDSSGKLMCNDEQYLSYLKYTFNIKEIRK